MENLLFVAAGVSFALITATLVFFHVLPVLQAWTTSRRAEVHVSLSELISLKLHRVLPTKIVEALVKIKEVGVLQRDTSISVRSLMIHELSGGDVRTIAEEIRNATRYGREPLPFCELAERQLAGKPLR